MQHLLYARHFYKEFLCINSFNLHMIPCKVIPYQSSVAVNKLQLELQPFYVLLNLWVHSLNLAVQFFWSHVELVTHVASDTWWHHLGLGLDALDGLTLAVIVGAGCQLGRMSPWASLFGQFRVAQEGKSHYVSSS